MLVYIYSIKAKFETRQKYFVFSVPRVSQAERQEVWVRNVWRFKIQLFGNSVTRDRCYDLEKKFAKKFGEKNWRFWLKTELSK
jgi:hypothetical protein